MKGSTKVNLYDSEYVNIKLEAEKASVPMSKILKDYALEYIKLKNETEAAKFGQSLEGSIIHTIITKMESRVAKTIEYNTQEIKNNLSEIQNIKAEMQILAAIIDNFIKFYLNHTPIVPVEKRQEIIKASIARYQRFLLAVKPALDNGNSKIIAQIKESVSKLENQVD